MALWLMDAFPTVPTCVCPAPPLPHSQLYAPSHPPARTPCRYLLKLRAEVEVMQQLGTSLNAVHLHEVFEDGTAVHMVRQWRGARALACL